MGREYSNIYCSASRTSLIQYLGVMCCVLYRRHFFLCGEMSGKTPWSKQHLPRTCRNKGKVWKWGQTSAGCFLLPSSLVLPTSISLPLLLPLLLPSQLFLLQVELISLEVDWVTLCLQFCWALVLFVCQVMFGINWAGCVWFLSGDYQERLLFYWCFHCRL